MTENSENSHFTSQFLEWHLQMYTLNFTDIPFLVQIHRKKTFTGDFDSILTSVLDITTSWTWELNFSFTYYFIDIYLALTLEYML